MKLSLFSTPTRIRISALTVAFLIAAPISMAPFVARAQNATRLAGALLPAPIVRWDGRSSLLIQLPAGARAERNRFRVALYEAGRPARVAEIQRVFTPVAGAWQTRVRLEAEPGRYEIRLVSSDKKRTPLSQAAPFVVSGIDREAGAWLLNGSLFARLAANQSLPNAGATPFFIDGLKRDFRSSKPMTKNITTPNAVDWRVLELPSLAETVAAGLDASRYQAEIARRLSESRARGEGGFIGCALPIGEVGEAAPSSAAIAGAVRQTRRILDIMAPTAALILSVDVPLSDAERSRVARFIDAAAPLCDAVVLQARDEQTGGGWPLKVARRVAEEQPNYDLPIFWRQSAADNRAFDALMSGATAIIEDDSQRGETDTDAPSKSANWRAVVERNAPLFIGAVTLEDTGILPIQTSSPASQSTADAAQTPQSTAEEFAPALYETLRDLGRVPLRARGFAADSKGRERGESLWTQLTPAATVADLDALRATARAGGRVFASGTARRSEADVAAANWENALGVTTRSITTQRTTMTLDDPWIFGVARGTVVPVEQNTIITLKPQPPEKVSTRKRDDDKTPRPRVVASLADGSPAIVITPLEKGEIAWMPNGFIVNVARPAANEERTFISAIAAYIQPSLVRIRNRAAPQTTATNGRDEVEADVDDARVAVRSSPKGTVLVALFNNRNALRRLTIEVQAAAGIALDLSNETALPLRTRGFNSSIDVDLPASGWKLIALSATRAELDAERNAPRLKARLR